MERGDNFTRPAFKVELCIWAQIRAVECEQKASSKLALSCRSSFLAFIFYFFPSIKHLELLTVPYS